MPIPVIAAVAGRVLAGAAARGVAARGGGKLAQTVARKGVEGGVNHMVSRAQANQQNRQNY
jgi:hypothetical protein